MIEKISLTNWMGHEHFEHELSKGKNLIYGRNAAGKSSLAKAIAFNLTGLRAKNVDPRRDRQQLCVVDLTIQGPDKKSYLVRRQIKAGSRINETLFVYDTNEPSEPLYTEDAADDFLRKMFGMKQDIFERIIYMKEEDVHEFLAKPDGGVLFEIDRLIGLDKAHQLSSDLEDLYRQLRYKHKDVEKDRKETETAVKRELGVKKSSRDIKQSEKRLGEIVKETEDLFALQGLLDKRLTLTGDIAEIKKLVNEKDDSKLEVKLIENQKTTQAEKTVIEKKVKEEQDKVENLILVRSTLEAKKELKDKIIDDLAQDKVSGQVIECPTCGRDMDTKLLETTIKKLKDDMKKIDDDLTKKISEMEAVKREVQKQEGKVSELDKKIGLYRELKQTTGQTLIEFTTNEDAIKQLVKKGYPKTKAEIDTKLDALDTEGTELNREIGRAEGAEEVTKGMVEKKLKQEEDYKHKMKIVELIAKATKETTEKLRETYTAEVKNKAEAIWKEYKGEPWQIEWDDKFVPKARVLTSERELLAYEMSGSEKFLIMLAIRLAIQQTLENFQLLIIDEPCQHLDEINGKLFRDILTNIDESKIGQSIVFTYNKDFLEGNWSNVIKLSD